ncbi:MAG TPA: hypothetical protein IAD37_03110 [Candidatus Limiplasma merdipullorum]|jgi:hypothetical protein|nr:hypothetical protein [Candidatus Limiplasma merdipullorum]
MSLIIADARLGVWKATDEGGPLTGVDCALEGPRLTCAGSACVCVGGNRECLCLTCHGLREISRMPAAPGLAALCLSPCGRYVYQLSSEADSVHTRLTATGDLIFAAPVGVFPRAMCLDASGRLLLAAGGAVDEAYLLTAPELVRERTIHTQSPCFAAGFWRGGLLLVCAVEGEDIHTAVYTLAPGTPRPRKLIDLPGQPGGLCVCPDGVGALISTRDGLMKLDIPQGRLLWNLPDLALCAGLCCRGPMALVSATLGGQVRLLSHYKPWLSKTVFTGTDVHACFLMA